MAGSSSPVASSNPPTAEAAAEQSLRQRMARMQELIGEVERFKDPQARARTREIIQVLMEFHGAAVGRLLERIADATAGVSAIQGAAEDELVANLLLLYGLHPVDLQTRVGQALEKARPFMKSHGGNVELLAIEDGVVRIRLHGSCQGCPSSGQTLKQTIEEAIFELAPDVAAIEVADELVVMPEVPQRGHFALPILAGS